MGNVMLVVCLLLNVLFDCHYFVRAVVLIVYCKIQAKLGHVIRDAFKPATLTGICLTTDLDMFCHMNNGRYLREADFGRYKLWLQNGIFDKAGQMKSRVTLGASTIRYRKSLQLFDRYTLQTSISCWDEKAFYVEQRFVRCKDNFVVAIMYAQQCFIGASPGEILRQLSGSDKISPDPPDDLKRWMEYIKLSSQSLKKSS